MSKNMTDSGWEPQPYSEHIRAQRPRVIPSDRVTVHDIQAPQNLPKDASEFPYPIIQVDDESRVHLVPVYTGLSILLTEASTGKIKSRTRSKTDFWLTYDGRQDVAEDLAFGLNSQFSSDGGLVDRLQNAFSEADRLSDPFDESLTVMFRPPTIRWLRDCTKEVRYSGEIDPNNPSGKEWQVTLEAPDESKDGTTISISHERFVTSQASVFRPRYNRQFPHDPRLRIKQPWWVDLSRFFIDEAKYVGVDTDCLAYTPDSELEYRQSGTGTYHLYHINNPSTVCGAQARSGNPVPFRPDEYPLPSAICSQCSREMKQQRFARRVLR